MDPSIATWLMVLAVATAISVAIQLGILVACFIGLRRIAATVKDLYALTASHRKVLEEMAGAVRESVNHVAKDVSETADRLKAVAQEGSDLSRRQIAHADRVVGDALSRAEKISEEVEKGILEPVRELRAITAGVRAGLHCLFRNESEPERRRQRWRIVRAWVLLIAGLGAAGAFPGQLRAQQAAEPGFYEGQKVAAIDLVARPSINLERLRPLVLQQAGEPYSGEKIQGSMEALNRTGLFNKVDLKVTPQAAGLLVEFVLEPAFYIGMISFPGTENNFDYARLFVVVNYPSQEPYEEERVQEAEAALVNFLIGSGYFLATVRTETEFDEENQLAHLRFHARLNERAKFGSVKVTGLPEEEAARVEKALHSFRARFKGAYVKEGKPYAPERLKAATAFIRDTLSRMNRLAEDVRLEAPRYDRETNRADITFQVTAGPSVEVETEGARVSKRMLRRLIPIYEENTFDQDLVEEGERNLVSHFQSKGYFDVEANSVVQNGGSQIRLLYQIDRGDRHRVMEVAIRGNRYFQDEALLSLVEVQPARFWGHGRFSENLLQKSTEALTNYYRDAGFEEVEVEARVADQGSHISVTFEIAEGPQTRVEAFRMIGNETQPLSRLAPAGLNMAPGKPYSQRLLNQDRDRIMASYLDLGYLGGVFESTVEPRGEDHRVAVTFRVEEGPRSHIEEVITLGGAHTRPWFIERFTQMQPGQPLSQGRLLGSESRLYEAGVFDWASVAPRRPITDQRGEIVLVKVHEAKRNTLSYGFGFEMSSRTANVPAGSVALPGSLLVALPSTFETTQKQFASPRGSVEYSRRNLRGEGESFSVAALLARLDQRLSFNYANPHFLRSIWNSLWGLSGERSSENPIYTERLGEASFQVERFLDFRRTKTLLFRYSFSRTTLSRVLIPELVPAEERAVRLSMLAASYVRDTRDRPLDAHRGFYQTVDFGIHPRWIGSNTNFVRLLGQSAYYRQVQPWLVWASNVRLGFAKSFAESQVPLSKRFFSGGASSLRGFPFNGAGPQRQVPVCSDPNDPATCTNITVPVGGNAVFIVNSEGRFAIPIKKGLGGVLFYDGGNVYDRIGLTHLFDDYSNTVGFGIRYDTPVGPVRFDVGRNLNPVAGIKATQIFVTLGQAF